MSNPENKQPEPESHKSTARLPRVTVEAVNALGASMLEEGPEAFADDTLSRLKDDNPELLLALAATAENFGDNSVARTAYIDGAVLVIRLLENQVLADEMAEQFKQ